MKKFRVMKIKPSKPGLIVRDPETKRPLPEDGKVVKWSSYWVRRKIEGAIVFCEGLEKDKKAKKSKKSEQNTEELNQININSEENES